METVSRTITQTPAALGWFIAEPISPLCQTEKHPLKWELLSIHYEPIIAWHIETVVIETSDSPDIESNLVTDTRVIPITIDGAATSTIQAIRRPDGSLTVPGNMEIIDENDLSDYFIDCQLRAKNKAEISQSKRLAEPSLARHLGVSRQVMHDLVKRGVLSKDKDGQIDVEKAKLALINRVRPNQRMIDVAFDPAKTIKQRLTESAALIR